MIDLATSPNALPALAGKNILLGITGGIAAYKSAELIRLLSQQGADVHVVMTPAATEFVQPLTFQALSGNPVHIQQWQQASSERGMPHIDLSRRADCILIAPCTANSIAKYANGLADNLLDNLVLARRCPLAIAPAMNVEMWRNAATQRNLAQLADDGVSIFGPNSGPQACGEIGEGRMLEPHEITLELAKLLGPQSLAGKRFLITAGPTYESIDPVRGLTNRSSGKMGYSLAQAAWLLGAEVEMVSGPTALNTPYGVKTHQVQSAKEMLGACQKCISNDEYQPTHFVGVAAVADYGVKSESAHKQKKTDSDGLQFDTELNPDILATVGKAHHQSMTIVGFAAETQGLDEYAQAKLERKNADFIVGNLAQHALGANSSEVKLYGRMLSNPIKIGPSDKLHLSLEILNLIIQHEPRKE